jgi:RND family efflux transporter MFP subunit
VFRFLIVLVATLIGVGSACGQQTERSRRITKSFTEPVEQSVAASSEVGIIVEANVKEGDRVHVGDTLAKINQAVLVKSLAIAKARAESTARLDAATSRMEMIKSQLDAIKSLVEGGHTNKFEVEQTEAEYQNAYAEYRAAQDELMLNKLEVDRIQAQVEDRIIRSPINGFVTEIHKQLGENVSNNDPKYATIVQVDQLKVRFYLETSALNQAKPGQTATILLGYQKTPTQATITYVSPIINADSGLGRLDVKIDNRDFQIKSGTVCYWGGVEMEATAQREEVFRELK